MTVTTPLFWDLHIHGVSGIDFMHADFEAMVYSCEQLKNHGIGFFAPTLLTARETLLKQACINWGAFLLKAHKKRFLPSSCAIPIGLHLEGPFLNSKMAGAHPKVFLKKPNQHLIQELIKHSQNQIRIVTLAPELKGTIPLIRKLSNAHIRVQLGHTMADFHNVSAAIQAGAKGITHLYNAMIIHHRHSGILAALRQGYLSSEIITDGIHIHPEFIYWCWKLASQYLYAVSDGCCVTGSRHEQKKLTLGSIEVEKKNSAAIVKGSFPEKLAGGATFLSTHPHRLQSYLGQKLVLQMLPLFYQTQARLFPKFKAFFKGQKNHFDGKTLRFLRCTSVSKT